MWAIMVKVMYLITSFGWVYYLCGLYNKCFVKLHDEDAKSMVAMGIFAEAIIIIGSIIKVITV